MLRSIRSDLTGNENQKKRYQPIPHGSGSSALASLERNYLQLTTYTAYLTQIVVWLISAIIQAKKPRSGNAPISFRIYAVKETEIWQRRLVYIFSFPDSAF